jgi:multimeric flavodoxin WrbA
MNPKHILILKGSPRPKGNSSLLADQVTAGAKESGATVEVFTLQDMDIAPCNACDACQVNADQVCTIDDDMQQIYPGLRKADAIVLAGPVYWFTLCAQLKLCIDRWYAFETPKGSLLRGKQFALLLAYGDTDPYTSGGINAIRTFEDMCRYLKAPVAGILYATAMNPGDVKKQPDLLERAFNLGKKLAG